MLTYDEFNDIYGPRFITVNTDDRFADYIREEFDKLQMRATCDPYIDYRINLNDFKTKKETNKMEAKKCDKCGKLYEMPGACEKTGVDVRFKYMYINGAEDMSGTKIAEKQTRNIYIKCGTYSDDIVDLCPECRKSLKKWFESTDKEEKKNV